MSLIVTKALKDWAVTNCRLSSNATDKQCRDAIAKALANDTLSADDFSNMLKLTGKVAQMPTAADVLGNKGRIEVKPESAKYCEKRYDAKHARTGKPVEINSRPVQTTSELQLAKCGTYFRWLMLKAGAPIRALSEHEKALLTEMLHEDLFSGELNGQWVENTKLAAHFDVKALINDSTSGGQNLVPNDFDTAVITYPLLHSELFPLVDVRDVSRDVVDGAAMGNVTLTWNTSEGSAQSLFTTTSLVSQLQTTIFPVAVYVEVGRDFLNDSPVNVGALLQEVIGQKMLAELDNVICNGNGTSQPQGIFNASGTTSVSSVNGTSGPLTVGDFEQLLFGVNKEYRQEALNHAYVMNDASYRRARSVAVSGTDQRRVFGMEHEEYMLLGRPVAIQNDIADADIAFGALKKYRLYRRQGFEFRRTAEGQTLFAKNTELFSVRGRFGGKVVDGSAFAIMNDAPQTG